jgi:hypothetical protein
MTAKKKSRITGFISCGKAGYSAPARGSTQDTGREFCVDKSTNIGSNGQLFPVKGF